jgi:hypothetical protein
MTYREPNPDFVDVPAPFAIGDTRTCKIDRREWLVHWRDETTLMLTPAYTDDWLPEQICGYGGDNSDTGTHFFSLKPDDALLQEAIMALDKAYDAVIGIFRQDRLDAALDKPTSAAGSAIMDARRHLDAALHRDVLK